MNYDLKAVINGIELGEMQESAVSANDISYIAPSITNVKLIDSVSSKTMEIGSTASDCLILTVLNPFKEHFDGDKIELYISPVESDHMTEKERLEEEVGDDISDEVIDEDDLDHEIDDDDEEGEEVTDDDLEDAETADSELEQGQYIFFEGEEDIAVDEDTDEAEEETWHKAGTYYVYTQKNADGGILLTCYDGFSRMNGIYVPSFNAGTPQGFYNDLKAQVLLDCGITLDDFEFDDIYNTEIKWDFECSYRKALGYLAGLVGGFAEFDENGIAGISFYAFSDNIILESDLISYTETSAGEILVDGISCNISIDGLGTQNIETGAGQSISFNNPFVTESILEDIFETYRGIRFTGAVINVKWEETLVSGTFARLFTEDEYRNYIGLKNALDQPDLTSEEIMGIRTNMNFLGKVIFISSQAIDFTGEATSWITSVYDGESVKENQIESPFDTKIKRAYVKTAEAQAAADAAAGSASQANTLAEAAQASADQAKQSADAAKTAADNAQSAVDAVEADVASLETSVDNAQKAADNAQTAAVTAKTAADNAQQSADNAAAEAETAKTNAAAAQTKAEEAAGSAASAQETAANAVTKAQAAQTTADAARSEVAQANEEIEGLSTSLETTKQTLEADYSKKTDLSTVQANLQAQITENAAQIEITHSKIVKVDETANDAKEKAEAASTAAGKAQTDATAAKTAAANAQTAADNAKTAADNAQSEADAAKTAATNAKSVADKAQSDLEAAQADLATVSGRVDATEEDIAAAQKAVTTAQAAADKAKQDAAAAQTKAETAQSAADDAATKATNAQTKADAAKTAADDAALAASNAQTDATAAKTAAANAQEAAETAQTTANTAKTNAATAQTKAEQAATDAAAAQTTADAAKTKAETAQSELTKAKENLEAVKSRVDATEEDIAAAEQAVQTAQSKADAAAVSAAAAQSTADTAKADAATAQTAADKAKADAAKAQTAADGAKAAAEAAQLDVDSLKTRVTKTETDIKKNADAIALTATKEEVTETLGGYYTKEEADAAVEVTAGSIRQEVSNTYATKQGLADANTQIETNKSQIEQTAKQLKLLIKSGDTEASLVLTDKLIELAAAGINLKGLVSFSGLSSDAQGKITSAQETATSAKDAADSATQRLISWCAKNEQTLIDGAKIYTGSITAEKISIEDLKALQAKIGGFTIGDTNLRNGTTTLAGADNSVYLGLDGISCGKTFKVDEKGNMNATSGFIGGFTIRNSFLNAISGGFTQSFLSGLSAPGRPDPEYESGITISSVPHTGKYVYTSAQNGYTPISTSAPRRMLEFISLSLTQTTEAVVNDVASIGVTYDHEKDESKLVLKNNEGSAHVLLGSDIDLWAGENSDLNIIANTVSFTGGDLLFNNGQHVGTTEHPSGLHTLQNNVSVGFLTTTGERVRGIALSSSNHWLFGRGDTGKTDGMFFYVGAKETFGIYGGTTKDVRFRSFEANDGSMYIQAPDVWNRTTSSGANVRVTKAGTLYHYSSSSMRYKTDITTKLSNELDPERLYDLKVWQYKYREGYLNKNDQRYGQDIIGFIAEDVKQKYPIAANYDEDGQIENWNVEMIVPAMLKLIQDQKKEIDELKERLN